ncbi:MAG: hypothetical protein ABIE70_10915 [bacterium]
MNAKPYLRISGSIFGVVACLHIIRLVMGWPVEIGGWSFPVWLSWLGLPAAGGLALWAFWLTRE